MVRRSTWTFGLRKRDERRQTNRLSILEAQNATDHCP
jgi:hypothetical protein